MSAAKALNFTVYRLKIRTAGYLKDATTILLRMGGGGGGEPINTQKGKIEIRGTDHLQKPSGWKFQA